MAKQLKLRGGTTEEHAGFIGVIREVTVDTDKGVVVVHDGSTTGGIPAARADHTHDPADTGSEPADANIQAHLIDNSNPHNTTALQVGAEPADAGIQEHIAATGNVHGATALQVGALPSTDVVTVATAGKVLKLDVNAKLPASVTGDAATVGGNLPDAFATVDHTHSSASIGAAGFMSATDKSKLDGVAAGATNYIHPTTDGSHHVPATGTTNNTKVLKSGAIAGSEAWGAVAYSEVTGAPTTLPASDVYAWAKTPAKPGYAASEVGAPSTSGVGATGTWPIAISGVAANSLLLGGMTAAQLSSSGARFAVFTANDSFTVPEGVTTLYVTGCGGGGGGGKRPAIAYQAGSGGGGGGGCILYPVVVTPGTVLSVTIGGGGASGVSGGSTSLSSLVTLGGGGAGVPSSAGVAAPGAGGSGPLGSGGSGYSNHGSAGGAGGGTSGLSSMITGGAGSGFAGGGGISSSGGGGPGMLYGGGGGGAGSISTTVVTYGGVGGKGIMQINW